MIIIVIFFLVGIGITSYFLFRSGGEELNINMVSGTEYISGEYGQVIVRVSDREGIPHENAICTANVLYPDKSHFLLDYPLIASSQPGNYFAEFMTPTINGIYEETITCDYLDNDEPKTLKISSSFHVSPALNFIVEMSVLQAERYWDLINRINATRMAILDEINETFNEDFTNLLMDKTDELLLNIELANNDTKTEMDTKFADLYLDMAQLGQSMNDIFQVPG